jgi:hypothetical protein
MGPLIGWIFIKLVDLINWMADASDRKALGRDIPSPSAQGRADAPHAIGNCLCTSCLRKREEHFKPGTLILYSATVYPTPDRPDPYISQVRKAYTTITGAEVAQNFPEGS